METKKILVIVSNLKYAALIGFMISLIMIFAAANFDTADYISGVGWQIDPLRLATQNMIFSSGLIIFLGSGLSLLTSYVCQSMAILVSQPKEQSLSQSQKILADNQPSPDYLG